VRRERRLWEGAERGGTVYFSCFELRLGAWWRWRCERGYLCENGVDL
jgi:hypothetical protein